MDERYKEEETALREGGEEIQRLGRKERGSQSDKQR